jgi:hypothetical protein
MNVTQLKQILEYFPPDEGYLRIQLIQSVFSHIVDLENMNVIIDEVLTVDERNEVSSSPSLSWAVFDLVCLWFRSSIALVL